MKGQDKTLMKDQIFPEVDMAWAAGVFDGEGYISIRRGTGTNLPFLIIGVRMCSFAVTQKLYSMFGGAFKQSAKIKTKKGIPICEWVASTNTACRALRRLLPYLVEEGKVVKAALGIEFQEQKWPGPGIIKWRGTPELAAYKQKQEDYRVRMRSLQIKNSNPHGFPWNKTECHAGMTCEAAQCSHYERDTREEEPFE